MEQGRPWIKRLESIATIAGGIAAVIGLVIQFTTTLNPFGYLWAGLKWLGSVAAATLSYRLPVWLVLVACIGFLILRRGLRSIARAPASNPSEPDVVAGYTRDSFWDIDWQWRYGYNGIEGIVALCPTCKNELDSTPLGSVTYFDCSNCQRRISVHRRGNPAELAAREIRRRLRIKMEERRAATGGVGTAEAARSSGGQQ